MLIDRTSPESDPIVQRLLEQSRERQVSPLTRREQVVESVAALTFLAAAVAFALLVDGGRTFDPELALGLVLTYAVAARIEFHTGSGWTVPTQLVFVPMLFLLPVNVVPLLVAVALLLFRIPEYVTGRVRPDRAVIQVGDSWHALGPAAVFALAGVAGPEWAEWPIYLAALGAQFAVDFATSALRECLGYGLRVRELIAELRGIYMVDALLSPIGLTAAFAAAQEPWAFLGMVPLLALLAIFAREREARIENALALGHAYRGTAHLLGELLSGTHEYTGAHSRTVVLLAQRVAEELGFDERELRDVEFGALLHDVGKISIPTEMLDKAGPLTDSEWAVMKQHTIEGERMLEHLGGWLVGVAGIVRSHHEHWDGRGYPDGLIGEAIPRPARVIAACDAFNAMTTDRSYRTAMSREAAIEELRACSGSQFDPAVVEVLIRVVKADESIGAGLTPRGPVMARHQEATRELRESSA
jgi:putative nucleotidyltransferase with HDIG domain